MGTERKRGVAWAREELAKQRRTEALVAARILIEDLRAWESQGATFPPEVRVAIAAVEKLLGNR